MECALSLYNVIIISWMILWGTKYRYWSVEATCIRAHKAGLASAGMNTIYTLLQNQIAFAQYRKERNEHVRTGHSSSQGLVDIAISCTHKSLCEFENG